jgi:glycosyltransferase involved in cell wall biosynthesis
MAEPLVSVGVPTYNRVAKLARAAESVLAQTHREVELVISDNASSDGTDSLGRQLCERDQRVRYLRSEVNRGPTANFNALFGELRGEYVMLLSDDDWLDEDYVAVCLAELRRRPDLVLACGRARYFRDAAPAGGGVQLQLEQDSPSRRVRTYLRDVDENGVFYGLMSRAALHRAAPLRNVLGNDWLLAAAVAAQGKIATLTTTAVNRELGGTSADFGKLAATLQLPRWQARIPHLVIAWEVFEDVAWRARAYRDLPAPQRAWLALAGAWAAIRWRSLAWHLTMPTFAALRRQRGGRWLWRAYDRFTRLMGAGRSDRRP